MRGPRVRRRRDAPTVVLALAVALLPVARREWGEAMQAELTGIDMPVERWRFTAGCAATVARRPAPGAVVSLAAPVVIVIATAVLTAHMAYLPLHVGLVAMVSVLGVVYLIGGRVGRFTEDARGSRPATAVRAGGALVLAGLTFGIVLGQRSGGGDVVSRASTGVPLMTVVIGLCLVGFLSLTSPALATPRVLTSGAGLGVGAAVVWLTAVLLQPPLPLSSGSAGAALTAAILLGAVIGAPREAAVLTALCAGLIGAVAFFSLAHLTLTWGPASWVPSDSAALTPAARLAQSRAEAGDEYLLFLLVGAIAAIGILVAAFRTRVRRWS